MAKKHVVAAVSEIPPGVALIKPRERMRQSAARETRGRRRVARTASEVRTPPEAQAPEVQAPEAGTRGLSRPAGPTT